MFHLERPLRWQGRTLLKYGKKGETSSSLVKASLIRLQKAFRQCASIRRAASSSLSPFATGTTIMPPVATIRIVNIPMLAAPSSPAGPLWKQEPLSHDPRGWRACSNSIQGILRLFPWQRQRQRRRQRQSKEVRRISSQSLTIYLLAQSRGHC